MFLTLQKLQLFLEVIVRVGHECCVGLKADALVQKDAVHMGGLFERVHNCVHVGPQFRYQGFRDVLQAVAEDGEDCSEDDVMLVTDFFPLSRNEKFMFFFASSRIFVFRRGFGLFYWFMLHLFLGLNKE